MKHSTEAKHSSWIGTAPPVSVLIALLLFSSSLAGQEVFRSGTVGDPGREAPLSAAAKNYEPLLQLSNRALDSIQAGKFNALYNEAFSDVLREDVERDWLIWQLEQIQELYGKPSGFGKQQWWFQEEKNQGRMLVHSIKILRFGEVRFKFVFTAQKKRPGKLRGFRWVAPDPPRSRLLDSSKRKTSGASGEAGAPEAGATPPADAKKFTRLKKISGACLQRLKKGTSCREFFSKLLVRQMVGVDFEKNFRELNRSAGAIQAAEPERWEVHATEFPRKKILTIRNLVRHERGQVWYVFSVYNEQPDKLVGFQVRPARPTARGKPEYYLQDEDGNRKRLR